MCVYLRTKFQVPSIILTSFRQVVILPHPHPPLQNEPLKSPTRLGLKDIFIRGLFGIQSIIADGTFWQKRAC